MAEKVESVASNRHEYAQLTDEGLKFSDPKLLDKFSKKMLSASLITGMLGCGAQYAANAFLYDVLPIEQDNAMTRGSFFHRIMELLFALPSDERTRDKALSLIDTVCQEKDFAHFATNGDALEWVTVAINNYFDMGGKPENARIADFKGRGGLEVRITGQIEGCSRNFHGFIDKLSYSKTGDYIIDDWKTGAKAKKYSPHARYEEGWPEARQQILYSYIINNMSQELPVKKARLIFPVAQKVVKVDIDNEEYVTKAVTEAQEAEKVLDKACEENLFRYKKSFLCHWCPLAKVCPAAMKPVRNVEKAWDAYSAQPDISYFGQSISFDVADDED